MTTSLKAKARERFAEKFYKTPSCWIWKGATSGYGYGGFYLDGRVQRAHRVAHILFKGPIPEGQVVLHTCDVPLCVRPGHLKLGTQAENLRDMVAKGRSNAGEKNPAAKLKDYEVINIVAKRRQGMTYKEIAELLAVNVHMVRQICTGTRWKSVTTNHTPTT